jgi:hypothetical protein
MNDGVDPKSDSAARDKTALRTDIHATGAGVSGDPLKIVAMPHTGETTGIAPQEHDDSAAQPGEGQRPKPRESNAEIAFGVRSVSDRTGPTGDAATRRMSDQRMDSTSLTAPARLVSHAGQGTGENGEPPSVAGTPSPANRAIQRPVDPTAAPHPQSSSSTDPARQQEMSKMQLSLRQAGHPLQTFAPEPKTGAVSVPNAQVLHLTQPGTQEPAGIAMDSPSASTVFSSKGRPIPDRSGLPTEGQNFAATSTRRIELTQITAVPNPDPSRSTSSLMPQLDLTTETEMSPDLPLDQPRVGGTLPSIAPTRPEIHHHVARQLAEAMFHNGNKPVELTLNPEELGRVRLSIKSAEHGIVVNVLAERAETLDLMRRHIDELSQEFQDLGYRDITFSFSESAHSETGADPDNPEGSPWSDESPLNGVDDTLSDRIHISTSPLSGLDLRL